MEITKIDDALKAGDRKLVLKLIKSGEKLVRYAYEGDFEGIVELIENHPVDLDYRGQDPKWKIEDAAKAGGAKDAAKIIALIDGLRTKKIKSIEDFKFTDRRVTLPDGELFETFKKNYKKPAVSLTYSTKEEITDPFCSNFGGLVVGKKGTPWPTVNGKEFSFLCQLNLSESQFVPKELEGTKLITLFTYFDDSTMAVAAWGYDSLEDLVCLNPEKNKPCCSLPAKVIWSAPFDDYPSSEELSEFEETKPYKDALEKPEMLDTLCSIGPKLGGYAHGLQNEPNYWEPEAETDGKHILQIFGNTRIGLYFPCDGALYVAKVKTDDFNGWAFDIQFY